MTTAQPQNPTSNAAQSASSAKCGNSSATQFETECVIKIGQLQKKTTSVPKAQLVSLLLFNRTKQVNIFEDRPINRQK